MHMAKRLQQSRTFESNFHGGGPIGLLFNPYAGPLRAPGAGADFGAAFAKSQAAAMNPPALLHGTRGPCGARPDLYLPLIRRIYHKIEPPRPGSFGQERD